MPRPEPASSRSRSTAARCARRRARCSWTPPSTATSRSPYFCYEPKLGQPVGACRMCLVEIEGMPEAPDRLLDAGEGRHGGDHDLRPREAGAERDRRVPARQPPARLPGLRQGRRVPAAGHLVRLGARALALHRAEAPLQEAARALAARRDRPRALHPLLPLRALLAGGRRGLPAGVPRARRPHLRRHPRRPPVRRRRSAATSWSCARWARSPPPPTASARARGTSRTRARSARSARASATSSSPIRDDTKVMRVLARDNEEVDDGWLCDKGRFGYQAVHSPERIIAADGARRRRAAAGLVGARAVEARVGARSARARAPPRSWAARRPTRRASSSSTCCATCSARRTSTRASSGAARPRPGARARAARTSPRARAGHRLRGRDPGARHRAGRRGADPRPARAQGACAATAPSWWWPRAGPARSTRTPTPRCASRRAPPRPRWCALADRARAAEGDLDDLAGRAGAGADALRARPPSCCAAAGATVILWGERLSHGAARRAGRGRAAGAGARAAASAEPPTPA